MYQKIKRQEKILIFGGSGQIGSHAVKLLSNEFSITFPSRQEVDITDRQKVEEYITSTKPDQILYSVGFTSIDLAPHHPKETLELNSEAVHFVTQTANKLKMPVHFLSTEVVFNGYKTDSPYKESDLPDPLSFCAFTKRVGELIVLDASPKNSVIRLIICFSSHFEKKSDIARALITKLKNGEEFSATTDQEINPIYVDYLVEAIEMILLSQAKGIFHVGATDYTTPFKFCQQIAKALNLDGRLIRPTSFNQFSKTRPQPRPQHEWLDVNKFLKTFGPKSLPTVAEGIKRFTNNLP